jgi:uncharacterized Tic20 family protein
MKKETKGDIKAFAILLLQLTVLIIGPCIVWKALHHKKQQSNIVIYPNEFKCKNKKVL